MAMTLRCLSGGTMSEVLRSVDVVLLSNTAWQERFGGLYTLSDSIICGDGGQGKDSCQVGASTF